MMYPAQWDVSFGTLWENHMSLFGIGISFKGCLFASVRRQCVVLHKLISAYENRTKSILAEEALYCDGRGDRGNCELQLAVCLVHAVFLKKKQTLQASSLFLSPRIKACLFKIPIFRWDAEISILKYSWKGSELVLYTSEDLNRYHQHRLRS